MDIERIRNYCLSLPMTTEDCAFGPDYLLFRVENKIFCCVGLERPDYFVLKCEPDLALDLRDRHAEIEGAWHWNKRYWNQVSLTGALSDEFILSLVDHSYSQIVGKLSRKVIAAAPQLLTVVDPFDRKAE